MTETPPGWYPDPADPSRNLYWDGTAWQTPIPAEAAPAPASRKKPIIIGAVVAVVVVIVVVVGLIVGLGGGSSKMTVLGTVTVTDSTGDGLTVDTSGTQATCEGSGGYADLRVGAEVVVTDTAGKTLAIGALTRSKAAGQSCVFVFEVQSVPSGQSFYGVTVTHRGTVQETKAQMVAGPTLQIGSS